MKMIMMLMMLADGSVGGADAPEVELLDFSASYCQPCQQMLPLLQKMQQDKFPVRKIDITEEPELAKRFNVERIPTLVLMVQGKEVRRFIGLTDERELRHEMNKAARQLSETRQKSAPPVNAVVEKEAPASGKSKKDGLLGMLGVKATPTSGSEIFRGQNPPETAESLTGLNRAAAATVRVRVQGRSIKDKTQLQDIGTGTIIYSAPGQALVLTCSHVFTGLDETSAVIEVEVFENGKPVSHRGTLKAGNHDLDLAILELQTSKIMPTVQLTAVSPKLAEGQELVSFGCNNGADPTPLNTKLVSINRYDGPNNLVCTSDPTSGRSGGGLFNSAGELLGVCSSADRKLKEGLYMAHKAIIQIVHGCSLQSILESSPGIAGEDASDEFKKLLEDKPLVAGVEKPGNSGLKQTPTLRTDLPSERQTAELENDELFNPSPTHVSDVSVTPALMPIGTPELEDAPLFDQSAPAVVAANGNNQQDAINTSLTAETGPELTILIDEKTPGSQKRVIVIPKASLWLLAILTGEADNKTANVAAARPSLAKEPTSTRNTKPSPSRTAQTRPLSQAR